MPFFLYAHAFKACETLLYPAVLHILRLVRLPGQYHDTLQVTSQRVNIWYHRDPHDQWKRMICGQKTISGLGLSLLIGVKLVSTNNGKLSIVSITFRLFPRGGEKNNCAAFYTTLFWTYCKACLSNFPPTMSKI